MPKKNSSAQNSSHTKNAANDIDSIQTKAINSVEPFLNKCFICDFPLLQTIRMHRSTLDCVKILIRIRSRIYLPATSQLIMRRRTQCRTLDDRLVTELWHFLLLRLNLKQYFLIQFLILIFILKSSHE